MQRVVLADQKAKRPNYVSAAACDTDRPTAHPAFLGECQRLLVWGHPPKGLAAHPRSYRAHSHPGRFPVPDEYLEPRHLQRAREKERRRGLDASPYLQF